MLKSVGQRHCKDVRNALCTDSILRKTKRLCMVFLLSISGIFDLILINCFYCLRIRPKKKNQLMYGLLYWELPLSLGSLNVSYKRLIAKY